MKLLQRALTGSGYTLPLLAFALSGLLLIAAITSGAEGKEAAQGTEAEHEPASQAAVSADEPAVLLPEDDSELETEILVTTKDTNMVYEYFYSYDGLSDIQTEQAPPFLVGKDEDYFRRSFSDWELISFSPDQVVMRKTVDDFSAQNFIIGVYDGYVAVFYADEVGGSGIREITDTPVVSLPEAEQERLRLGIPVGGEENLIRAMQDFES